MERKREKKQQSTKWAVAITQLFVVVVTMMMMTNDGSWNEIINIDSMSDLVFDFQNLLINRSASMRMRAQ